MRKTTKLLGLGLALCLCLTAICGIGLASGYTPTSTSAPQTFDNEVTLDLFNLNTTSFSGNQAGWFGKILKDRWNLVLNIIPNDSNGTSSKFQAMAASGNLGDIVMFSNPGSDFQQSIAAGLLYDLSQNDTYIKDMPYFTANFPQAVQRMKTAFSNSGSGVYGIPTRVSMMPPTQSQNATEVNYGIMIRWDWYTEGGNPQLNTLDDVIPCFEAMKAAHPALDDGTPTYAASIYPSSDNAAGSNHAQTIEGLYGYAQITSDSVLFVDSMAEKYQDVLQDNSYYMQGLKFFYTLNQKGLLDPDSLTQNGSDASAKFGKGQIFYSNWYWEAKNAFNKPENTAQGIGYEMAPLKDQKISSPGFYPGGDNGPVIALGAQCKDVDRALAFYDWSYTPDGVMTLYNGAEGQTWNYVDGKAVLTDLGKQALPMNAVAMPDEFGGSTFADGFQQISLYPLSNAETNPMTGEAYKFANWSSTLSSAMSTLDKNWSAAMGGARYTKEYLVQNNMLSVIPGNLFKIPVMSDDMKSTRDQVGNILKQYSWQMMFAKDDAEFDSLKAEMISKAKDLGYDDLVAYYVSLVPDVHQARVDAVNSVK